MYAGAQEPDKDLSHNLYKSLKHLAPGGSSWDNIVASCAPCNRRKGDALPRQVGMSLRRKPRRPRAHVFIHVASPSIPPAWRAYLPDAA